MWPLYNSTCGHNSMHVCTKNVVTPLRPVARIDVHHSNSLECTSMKILYTCSFSQVDKLYFVTPVCSSSSSSCLSSVFPFFSLYLNPPPTPFDLSLSFKFMCGILWRGCWDYITHRSHLCGQAPGRCDVWRCRELFKF